MNKHEKYIIKIDDKCFFIKNKNMNRKNFLDLFHVVRNSYLYELYNRLYDYIIGNSINLYNEYKSYYKCEYEDFATFLVEHYNIPESLVKKYDNRYSYYKYMDVGKDQPLSSLMYDETIKEIVKEFIGGFIYED